MKVCPLTFCPVSRSRAVRLAFTLVEMLVVMGVIVALLALVVPATNTMLRGNDLTQSGQEVSNTLGVARQLALTQNHPFEVRLYQFADTSKSGEVINDASSWKYRALQVFSVSEAGVATPIDKVHRLANGAIIDSGMNLSTLIGNAVPSSGTAVSGPLLTNAPQTFSLPEIGTNYNSVAFRFFPDGSTNLPITTTNSSGAAVNAWFLTVHQLIYGDNPGTVPANFLTIQIDPSNGNIREFRP